MAIVSSVRSEPACGKSPKRQKGTWELAADRAAPFPARHIHMCAASLNPSDKAAYKYLIGPVLGCR
jgi:hypothetical protein